MLASVCVCVRAGVRAFARVCVCVGGEGGGACVRFEQCSILVLFKKSVDYNQCHKPECDTNIQPMTQFVCTTGF